MICIIQKTVKIQSFRSLQTGARNPIISNQLKRMVENSAGGGIQSSVQCTMQTWYAVRKVEEAPAAVSARVPTNKARIYSIWLIWCGLRQKRRSWFYWAFIVGLYFIKISGDSYWANEAHLMKRRKRDAVLSFQSRVRMNLISRFFSYSFLFPVRFDHFSFVSASPSFLTGSRAWLKRCSAFMLPNRFSVGWSLLCSCFSRSLLSYRPIASSPPCLFKLNSQFQVSDFPHVSWIRLL